MLLFKAQLGSLWGPNVKCEGPFGHELSPKQRKWALSSRQVGVVRAQLGRAGSAMEAMWGPFWVSTETHLTSQQGARAPRHLPTQHCHHRASTHK